MKKEYNYGIGLLRIWMCFEVVLNHFRTWSGWPGVIDESSIKGIEYVLYFCGKIAVPFFMLSAFVFCDILELVQNDNKMQKRIYRLLVPHVFWTVIYFIIYHLLEKQKGIKLLHGVGDFFWQLMMGHSYNSVAWFQIDLIILTILFWMIFKYFKIEKALIITIILGCFALFLQYSGIVVGILWRIPWPEKIMGGYFTNQYIIYSIGRIVEMLPYAVIGILFGNYQILEKLKKYYKEIIGGAVAMLCIFLMNDFFPKLERGFGYQGIRLIVITCLTFLLFYFLPLGKNEIIKRIAMKTQKYTMTIYFIHLLIGTIIYNLPFAKWLGMRKGSLYDCGVIFVLCYLIAAILSKVPIKWIQKWIV